MSLEDKLKQMHDRAERVGQKTFQQKIHKLAELVAKALKDRNFNGNTKLVEEIASKMCEDACLLDAAECIQKTVLSSSNGKVVDVRVKRNWRKMQNPIKEIFRSQQVPHRGFVYVAWSKSPERYLYVGKAGSLNRLNFATNGNLARAIHDACWLSLLFPTQSQDKILREVEASVLALIKNYVGNLPEFNCAEEHVPSGSAVGELENIALFLDAFGIIVSNEAVK